MFERFFKGNQKEAVVTNEMMLANELRTPKGSYFNNLKTIVAVLTLAGFVLPLAPMDKAFAGPLEESKKISIDVKTNEGKQRLAKIIEQIRNEKGFEVSFQASESGRENQSFHSKIIRSKEDVPEVYSKVRQEAREAKEDYSEVSFQTPDGQPFPLSDFVDALDVKIHPAVYYNLDQANYRVVFCRRDQGVDIGLVFRVKRGESLSDLTQIHGQVTAGLASWGRTTVFADLENIFYPQGVIAGDGITKFQEALYSAKSGTWKDTIRCASIKDRDGKEVSIAYNYSMEEVRVANSRDCLEKMLDVRAPQPEP